MRAARAKAEIATGANNTKAAAIEPNLAALVKALNLVIVIPSDMNSLLVSEMPAAQFIDAQRPTFLSATLRTSRMRICRGVIAGKEKARTGWEVRAFLV